MAGRMNDKVVLVAGAGAIGPGWGNGKAAAVLYARENASVIACDINTEAARETVEIIHSDNTVTAKQGFEGCGIAGDRAGVTQRHFHRHWCFADLEYGDRYISLPCLVQYLDKSLRIAHGFEKQRDYAGAVLGQRPVHVTRG